MSPEGFLALVGSIPLFALIMAAVWWFFCVMFLWHGYHYFREMRDSMAEARVCVRCGREILVAGAKFCGRCGGQVVRAA